MHCLLPYPFVALFHTDRPSLVFVSLDLNCCSYFGRKGMTLLYIFHILWAEKVIFQLAGD